MNSTTYYLSAWQRLDWNPSGLEGAAVEPELTEMLTAAAFVEGQSFEEGRKARLLGLTKDPQTRQFLEIWLAEESEHSRALGFLARSHGLEPDCFVPGGAGPARRMIATAGLLVSRGSPLAASAAFGIGAAAEYMTRAMYRVLAERSSDSVVKRLFCDLAAQEGRHLGFFLGAAKAAHADVAEIHLRATRSVLRRIWRPVGVDRLGLDRWLSIFGPLFSDAVFADHMSRMDRTLDRIPVMHGMQLMSRFQERWTT